MLIWSIGFWKLIISNIKDVHIIILDRWWWLMLLYYEALWIQPTALWVHWSVKSRRASLNANEDTDEYLISTPKTFSTRMSCAKWKIPESYAQILKTLLGLVGLVSLTCHLFLKSQVDLYLRPPIFNRPASHSFSNLIGKKLRRILNS